MYQCVQELGKWNLADADSATNAIAETRTAPMPSGHGISRMDDPPVTVRLNEVAHKAGMGADVCEPSAGAQNTRRLAENRRDVVHIRVQKHRGDGVKGSVLERHRRCVRADELFCGTARSIGSHA
jgi:hypothetical protein